uniref:Uncharacterized protein n=1 Tax=Timema shepardi TaxID=629360 RepID=A0A7R9B9X2_TIMSH|nr:unnamed protein product [Timema shepardi]
MEQAKLNHQEAKKRKQRAKEWHQLDIRQAEERHLLDIRQAEEQHCLDIRQAEELRRLVMERIRLKMEFEVEMNR